MTLSLTFDLFWPQDQKRDDSSRGSFFDKILTNKNLEWLKRLNWIHFIQVILNLYLKDGIKYNKHFLWEAKGINLNSGSMDRPADLDLWTRVANPLLETTKI